MSKNTYGEKWPTYCSAFYSTVTPALRQLSCEYLSIDIWKEVDQVFGRRLGGDLSLRSNVWSWHHHRPYGELPQPRVFNGLASDPISRILVSSSPINFQSERPIPPFEYADCVKHLGMPASHAAWRALHESDEPVEELCDLLMTMPNLSSLWVVLEPTDWKPVSYGGYAARARESHVVAAASVCPRLSFVRIANHAWRVKHSGSSGIADKAIELERLDDWEDIAECPEIFYCPEPLSWSHFVQHADC
ncbi:hypothetical protein IF2G_05908 [Cordyceps javanica]|nr:hypothetical protein IF2G_05908 [Cordyceps javanica]